VNRNERRDEREQGSQPMPPSEPTRSGERNSSEAEFLTPKETDLRHEEKPERER